MKKKLVDAATQAYGKPYHISTSIFTTIADTGGASSPNIKRYATTIITPKAEDEAAEFFEDVLGENLDS